MRRVFKSIQIYRELRRYEPQTIQIVPLVLISCEGLSVDWRVGFLYRVRPVMRRSRDIVVIVTFVRKTFRISLFPRCCGTSRLYGHIWMRRNISLVVKAQLLTRLANTATWVEGSATNLRSIPRNLRGFICVVMTKTNGGALKALHDS